MHRIYQGFEFYTVPGGHIRKEEDPKVEQKGNSERRNDDEDDVDESSGFC